MRGAERMGALEPRDWPIKEEARASRWQASSYRSIIEMDRLSLAAKASTSPPARQTMVLPSDL